MARKNIVVVILSLSILTHSTAAPVQAATITVTSKLDTPDPGKCRLRDAIIAANTNTATGDCSAGAAGIDTIGFNLGLQCTLIPCTITLTSALPAVTENLTINGSNTIISGANTFRVFELGAVTANISNLSVVNGNASGAPKDEGGAVNMQDTALTLTNVFFSNNHAFNGGAIYQASGTLTVTHGTFSGNVAQGGAIYQVAGSLSISNSLFSNNRVEGLGSGGALYFDEATLSTLSTSTFSGNSSLADRGGAIANYGQMDLRDSVFNNNAANGQFAFSGGGAIYTEGTATLTNVTISGNSAKNNGGGIKNDSQGSDIMILNNVTITKNTADSDNDGNGDGGGVHQLGNILVQNSIIAGNFDTPGNSGGGTINADCSGTFASLGHNLIGRSDGCSGFVNGNNGNQVGNGVNPIDPHLGALVDNDGPTQTHALLPGSPAIDAGNSSTPGSASAACDAFDQRGIARPQGNACDMGAFESEIEFLSVYLPLIFR